MNNSITDQIRSLEELAFNAEVEDEWVKNCLDFLSVQWNQTLAASVYNYLILQQDGNYFIEDVFELPSDQSGVEGELNLGHIIGKEEIEFRLPINKLPMHVLAVGTSGSGKTNFGKILAEQAYLKGVHSIKISDPKADEYEDLAIKYPEFLMFRWSELRFNPLTPPTNVPRNEWHQTIVGHMSQCFNFWEGAESLLLRLLDNLSRTIEKPTIPDLMVALENEKPKYGQKDIMVMGTVASRLEMLLHTLGNVITTESTMLDQLSQKHYVLSTTGLMSETESWLLEFQLIRDFMYRSFNSDKRFLTLHLYDECQHRLFNREKEKHIKKISSSMISMLVDEARSLNIGICSMSQEPSVLIKSVLNNSFLKVAFHLGSGSEVRTMKEAMGLNSKQEEVLHYLETGEAIARMAGGYMDAFPVKIDEFKKAENMDKDEFIMHQKKMMEELYRDSGIDKEDSITEGKSNKKEQAELWEEFDVLS